MYSGYLCRHKQRDCIPFYLLDVVQSSWSGNNLEEHIKKIKKWMCLIQRREGEKKGKQLFLF